MYRAVYSDGIYRIHKDELELKTPAGRDLICESRELAERLTLHLTSFGQAHDDPVSIAAFHYPWLDFGQIISREAGTQSGYPAQSQRRLGSAQSLPGQRDQRALGSRVWRYFPPDQAGS